MRCSYCAPPSLKLDIGKVVEQLELIFSRFDPAESCVRVECFGEVTLYPDLIEYLERKARGGYVIEVLSNGTRALDVISDDTGLRWVFSLDGHTADMNKARGLNSSEVEKILTAIMKFNAEIQCVFSGQSVDEMNSFILYLSRNHYKGFLHIFPVRNPERPQVRHYLDYAKLVKTEFIPDAEYFRRWKYIFENGQRGAFTCDQLTNGYVYNIHPDGITMVKCDCGTGASSYVHPLEAERTYDEYSPCETCITHLECNNKRVIVSGEMRSALTPHATP
jgi:MoaA/NifB/PqqE/SkfB family radical SAM enzyme